MKMRMLRLLTALAVAVGMCPFIAHADDLTAGTADAEAPVVPSNEAPASGSEPVPVTVVVSSAKSLAPGTLTVKAKGDKAGSYQFQVATNAGFTKNRVIVESKDATCTFKKLKKGTTYRVRVRAKASADDVAWGKWSGVKTARVQNKGTWKMKGGYATYLKPNGKLARGLVGVKGKTYLFDSKGRQKTGWQNVKGTYRYFKVGLKSKGAMVTNRVVNGIKLAKNGKARYGSVGLEEIKIMVKAQKLAEKITKPSQSKRQKLEIGFNWMLYNCKEQMIHQFGSYAGWHRTFANEIYDLHNGSCFSYGAAFAYYANAIGYKSCRIVSSGGHGWAEIDGDVYDIEWTRHNPNRYFAWPYSKSGFNGAPGYASARIYVVQITPNTRRW